LVQFSLHFADQAGTLNDHPVSFPASVLPPVIAGKQTNSFT